MKKYIKYLCLIGIICLALSFGNTREWFKIGLIIADALIMSTGDDLRI